jgi:hypothetical protein
MYYLHKYYDLILFHACCVIVLLLFCVRLIVLVQLLATWLLAQHLNNEEMN